MQHLERGKSKLPSLEDDVGLVRVDIVGFLRHGWRAQYLATVLVLDEVHARKAKPLKADRLLELLLCDRLASVLRYQWLTECNFITPRHRLNLKLCQSHP